MGFTIGAGFSVGAGFGYRPSITATAGATTTVSVTENTAITSFNPFSLVEFGTTPYTYFVSSGTLPTGITIDSSTGLVSGTPTVVQGAANVTFSVRDAGNEVATTTSTVSFAVTGAPFTVQYLVVAGGGGGAGGSNPGGYGSGGGGGAGGMLYGAACFSAGTTYTIDVGLGGAGGSPPTSGIKNGMNGSSSNIVGTGVSISSVGGGGGAGICCAQPGFGAPGGSGGGNHAQFNANYSPTTGQGTGFPGIAGSTQQGRPGGYGIGCGSPPSKNYTVGGGGGGAGGPGSSGCRFGTSGSPGGSGAIWTYTGPAVYYAGGGGSGSAPWLSMPGAGTGGIGGGGAGSTTSAPGTPGTPGTGGGGGSNASVQPFGSAGNGGNGGSGVIKLAVPTPNYPGAYGPQATTPPAAPGMTVITFTSPGSYTA